MTRSASKLAATSTAITGTALFSGHTRSIIKLSASVHVDHALDDATGREPDELALDRFAPQRAYPRRAFSDLLRLRADLAGVRSGNASDSICGSVGGCD
jgi:hypothetical protein